MSENSGSPLVSVLVATYNAAGFIGDTLASIKRQTYPSIQTVIVDDGSTDETVERIATSGMQCQVVLQENMGRGAARQRALAEARGTYVALLDHDDLLVESSVERRVRHLETRPGCQWVYSDATEFDEFGVERSFLGKFPWVDPKGDPFVQLLRGVFVLSSTVMMRASVLEEIGGFRKDLVYGEDLELFLRLALVSHPEAIPFALTRRRLHVSQGSLDLGSRWSSRIQIFGTLERTSGQLAHRRRMSLQYWLRHAHYKQGEWLWENDRFRESQRHFEASRGLNWWTPLAQAYTWAADAPKLVRFIRKVKGRGL